MIPAAARHAARCFAGFADAPVLPDLKGWSQIPAGFSGSAVYRVIDPRGSGWSLKQLTASASVSHVKATHQVLVHVRRAGCDWVSGPNHLVGNPSETVADLGTHGCWEMTQWMPGRSYSDIDRLAGNLDEAVKVLTAGCRAIACFHDAAASMVRQNGPAPSVIDRIKRLDSLSSSILSTCDGAGNKIRSLHLSPVVAPELLRACHQITADWPIFARQIRNDLEQRAGEVTPIQWVVRDVHRGHLLFTDDSGSLSAAAKPTVSGMIDFDAMRLDTPAADLARWIGDFLFLAIIHGDAAADIATRFWQAGLAEYRQIRSFSEQQQTLCWTLVRSSSLISLANWVDWILQQRRRFLAADSSIAQRLVALNQQWTIVRQATDR
ncbi:phosphotransferase [Crateriforma conspicua]|uniref:Phosphotransferase enzyme family protein n=1 Tax=Crateriforma conspicua TaxID=2527996 RepID=A0A5C6FWF4_9PLAN|nr:phosphotransferase [Crateriforma conspicua]TWU66771.1 Phosphotransferase enzyme family protein [Crateriforma conspicua]